MRLAISADDPRGLESAVSPHFGRCPYFVIVDIQDRAIQTVRALANPYYDAHQPGQVPSFIHEQGADVMVTGGMGARAIGFFQEYGIEPVTGAYGTVQMAVQRYLAGELQGAGPCRESVEHGHGEAPAAGTYEKDEVGRLREEAEALQQQLDEVTQRLRRLREE
ncbi:MAG: NifB/NifX family molybdenum-iron cluster-binding protein [Anaerolineae bacterium]